MVRDYIEEEKALDNSFVRSNSLYLYSNMSFDKYLWQYGYYIEMQ
jgi:hypothetical protein